LKRPRNPTAGFVEEPLFLKYLREQKE